MSGKRILVVLLLSAVMLPAPLTGQENRADATLKGKALVHALQTGGYVIYFRHAATDRSRPDAEQVDYTDCKTQRDLSDQGREQSRAIGKAFAALRIPVARVIVSPYCRAAQMARLAFDQGTVDDNLVPTIKTPEAETKRLADHLRKLLATTPPKGMNTLLISHSSNLKDATGIFLKPEGAAYVFRPDADGQFLHVGQVLPDEWVDLAKAE